MILKEKAIKLRNQGLSYQAIATLFCVSRARIHQICSGYDPTKIKKYKNVILNRDNFECQWKNKCSHKKIGFKDLVIHHIDGNNKNNDHSNLITLCKNCHGSFHGSDYGNFKYYVCKKCKKTFKGEEGNLVLLKCNKCIKEDKEEREKYWSFKHKLFGCKKCGTNIKPHRYDGLCSICVSKRRWKEDTEYRRKHSILVRQWRKNNPEKTKKIWSKANKKYRNSHKFKMSQKNAIYYFKKRYKENWKEEMKKRSKYLPPVDK
jgi:predicted transcriptional regulator